jgi:hypothetical protein
MNRLRSFTAAAARLCQSGTWNRTPNCGHLKPAMPVLGPVERETLLTDVVRRRPSIPFADADVPHKLVQTVAP